MHWLGELHNNLSTYRRAALYGALAVTLFFAATFAAPLTRIPIEVSIAKGSGVIHIADTLKEHQVIRSRLLFTSLAVLRGRAGELKPGVYTFEPSSMWGVINELIRGGEREVRVIIREGDTVHEIDAALAESGVIKSGALIDINKKSPRSFEGFLFPDTYHFFIETEVEDVVRRLFAEFEKKAAPLLPENPNRAYEKLILASLLEREVPTYEDMRLVAGILEKRMKNGWLLQVDATICYVKKPAPCYPLGALDLKRDTPYNTYINKGLPPTPIANPGVDAIRAAMSPRASRYWFYLSDPATGKTIFAETLDEHVANRNRYLR